MVLLVLTMRETLNQADAAVDITVMKRMGDDLICAKSSQTTADICALKPEPGHDQFFRR